MHLLTNGLQGSMGDYDVTRPLCGTIEECRVAAVEPVGSHHTHLGPVGEEDMVFKHGNSERIRSLGSTVEHYFPGKRQHLRLDLIVEPFPAQRVFRK